LVIAVGDSAPDGHRGARPQQIRTSTKLAVAAASARPGRSPSIHGESSTMKTGARFEIADALSGR
jgi:hypothetical protein